MSHTLFARSTFSNARVWAFLKQVDAAEARVCRSAGCPRCGRVLHSATYPRKPHGLAASLRHDVRRFSFCCAACRRRVTPPSSRFFGRRFRVAPLFLVVSALMLAGGARLEAVARQWGVPVLTLRRWRRWWREGSPRRRRISSRGRFRAKARSPTCSCRSSLRAAVQHQHGRACAPQTAPRYPATDATKEGNADNGGVRRTPIGQP